MSERHQECHQCPSRSEHHQRPSRSERQQRRISTQLNLIANQLPEVNQDFLNLARSQLEAFNELQRSHQSAQPSQRCHSRSPAPARPRSRAPSPYTNYRRRTSPASAAYPWTPPTPHRPVTPQEPSTEDSGTLPDTPNRSPSVHGWDTYVTGRRPAPTADHYRTRPHSPHYQRGNQSACGNRYRHRARRTRQRNVVQDSPLEQDNRSGANRGRGQRQRPRPLHERIPFSPYGSEFG